MAPRDPKETFHDMALYEVVWHDGASDDSTLFMRSENFMIMLFEGHAGSRAKKQAHAALFHQKPRDGRPNQHDSNPETARRSSPRTKHGSSHQKQPEKQPLHNDDYTEA